MSLTELPALLHPQSSRIYCWLCSFIQERGRLGRNWRGGDGSQHLFFHLLGLFQEKSAWSALQTFCYREPGNSPPHFLFYSLLSLLGPFKHQKVSPDQGQDGVECDKATQHTRLTDRLRPRHKDTLPRSLFCEEKNCSLSSVLSGSGREIRTQARGQSVLSVSKVQAGTYSLHPIGHAWSQPK